MPHSILVVDDDPAILQSLVFVLEDEGFAVRSASNGRAALALHEQERADLILSDVMMPLLDGVGVVAELRGRGDHTPVILMSAVHTDPVELGVASLAKPFSLDRLFALIQEILVRG